MKFKKRNVWVVTFVLAGLLVLTIFTTTGCGKDGGLSLDYSSSPANVIIQVKTFGGMPAPWDDTVPSFTLHGDGTVVKWGDNELKDVLVSGKMTDIQINDLLARIQDTGFFDLETWYQGEAYDYTFTSIEVNLQHESHKVTDYFVEIDAFKSTLQAIMEAPVQDMKQVSGSRGYLVVQTHQSSDKDVVADSNSDIYALLPDASVLQWAAKANQPVGIPGKDFALIKRYAADHNTTGLVRKTDAGDFILYPVYEPR
jgi:hypothetical protein